jgi:hypothetical protein
MGQRRRGRPRVDGGSGSGQEDQRRGADRCSRCTCVVRGQETGTQKLGVAHGACDTERRLKQQTAADERLDSRRPGVTRGTVRRSRHTQQTKQRGQGHAIHACRVGGASIFLQRRPASGR